MSTEVEIAAIKEGRKASDREIRDLKASMTAVNDKLASISEALAKMHDVPADLAAMKEDVKALTAAHNERAGAIKIGKWIVTSGFFGLIGSAALAIWQYFKGI
jgi:chromosome segregation ATPase